MSISRATVRMSATVFAVAIGMLATIVGAAGAGPLLPSGHHHGQGELRAFRANRQDGGPIAAAPASGRTVAVGTQPAASALDPVTRTLYVANGPAGTISVIDAADCNARVAAGCRRKSPTVKVGGFAADVAVNSVTDTVYVANGAGDTVSVIDGATCNALRRSGCGQKPATVTVGSGPVALAVDVATGTVYVANFGSSGHGRTVSLIDGRRCNARNVSGCGKAVASVRIGVGPNGVIVDRATDTVYAATVAPNGAEAMWVIDGQTCNAADTSGCGRRPPALKLGNGTADFNVGLAIDRASKTLYVTNYNDSTLSMIDVATCSRLSHAGCATPAPVVAVGSNPTGVAVDRGAHTVFVSNQGDNTYSALDAARCNARRTSGCSGARPRAVRTGRAPVGVTFDAPTATVYVPNTDDNTVSVLNGANCNADRRTGCTPFPPTFAAGAGPNGLLVDHPLHTLYLLQSGDNDLAVLAERTCNVRVSSGCTHPRATIPVGNGSQRGTALDLRTGTIYVPNLLDDTVSVIDTRTCSAGLLADCSATAPTLGVPAQPVAVAVNDATDSVYVATLSGTVAVFDGTTCNASDHSGCGQAPASVTVGRGDVNDVVADPRTNTIYSADQGGGSVPIEHTVSVIDGRTCNGTDHSGCGETPPTVSVPAGPNGLALDQRTNTLYDTTYGDPQDFPGFGPGAGNSVSMIDVATCNAVRHSGCRRTPPRFRVGNGPIQAAIDTATGAVYVVNLGDYSVTRVDGATCNATRTSGCRRTRHTIPVGGFPVAVSVDPSTRTVFASNAGDSTVSFFSTRRR